MSGVPVKHPRKLVGPATRNVELGVVGRSGLKQSAGIINEEWQRSLTGKLGVETYREMYDNDSALGTIFHLMDTMIKQIDYPVKPAAQDLLEGEEFSDEFAERAQEAADLLDSCMHDMTHSWRYFVGEANTCCVYGWSWFEEVYKLRLGPDQDDKSRRSKYNDGRIGWRKFDLRAQETLERWVFDDNQSLVGMIQSEVEAVIPIDKSLLFRIRPTKGNPEGRSLLRNLVRAWRFLKVLQELESIVYERGPGLPVIFVPPELLAADATADQKTELSKYQKLGAQIRVGERMGIVFPSPTDEDGKPTGYAIEFISPGTMGQGSIRDAIRDYRKELFTALAAMFMLLGQNEHGSFALASSHTGLWARVLDGLVNGMLEVVNAYAVPRLMRFNGIPREYWPTIEHGDFEKQAVGELVTAWTALLTSGAVTRSSDDEDWLRKQLGAPPKDADADAAEADVMGPNLLQSEPGREAL